jgi:hypothetical protein
MRAKRKERGCLNYIKHTSLETMHDNEFLQYSSVNRLASLNNLHMVHKLSIKEASNPKKAETRHAPAVRADTAHETQDAGSLR